jgi:DNA-binding CsgD family transcriptional regulator/catechol 2,3-dioxygenase-like lactoylglutathione lyase family enzyme
MPQRPRGRPPHDDLLTPAEWRTVEAVRHGLGNARIARLQGVSSDAVKYHVANAIAKLGLADRRALRHWRGVVKHSAQRSGEFAMNDSVASPAVSGTALAAVQQIARTVKDIAATKAWYADVLGLAHLYTFGKLSFFDCGGVRLYLQEGEPGAESIVYFRVADIQATFDRLSGKGVRFHGAPHMIYRHADGMEEWLAIFDDLEGRPLGLMAQLRPRPAGTAG